MSKEDSAKLQKILEATRSPDDQERNEAILVIGMILEKNTPLADQDSFYETILPSDLMSATVDENLQRKVVDSLFEDLEAGRGHATMLWAIGKALPTVALEPLLELLKAWPDSLGDDAAFEAILALQKFLPVDEGGYLLPEIEKKEELKNAKG